MYEHQLSSFPSLAQRASHTDRGLMVDCTPYLLQLGLTKSRTSLVWIAGPLSGLIIHPLIGVIADRSRSRWGRRRPFMLGGALIVAFCLLLLGWTSEVVGWFVHDAEKVRPESYGDWIEEGRRMGNLTSANGVVETECNYCGCGFGDLWG